jgi:hypothetical protein
MSMLFRPGRGLVVVGDAAVIVALSGERRGRTRTPRAASPMDLAVLKQVLALPERERSGPMTLAVA